MPAVLTTASTVECGHGNAVGITSSRPLTVEGQPVLTSSEIQAGTKPTADPPPSTDSGGAPQDKPCTSFTVSSGTSVVLTTGGAAVALDTLGGLTDGLDNKEPATELSCGDAGQQALTTAS